MTQLEARTYAPAIAEPTAMLTMDATDTTHSDATASQRSASTLTIEEKLSLLYWGAAVAMVGIAVALHPVALALFAPLIYDVVHQARTGRSAGVRTLKAISLYRRLARRDRLADAEAGTDLSTIVCNAARGVAASASSLLDRGRTAARRGEGDVTSEHASGSSSSLSPDAAEVDPAGVGADAASGPVVSQASTDGFDRRGGGLSSVIAQIAAVAARAFGQAPADLMAISRGVGDWIFAYGRVRTLYAATAVTAAGLAMTIQPLFAVILPALVVDYALWRWQGTSVVAELASARVTGVPAPAPTAAEDAVDHDGQPAGDESLVASEEIVPEGTPAADEPLPAGSSGGYDWSRAA